MLGAQSLRKLKQFRLVFDDSFQGAQWRQGYPLVLRAIISNLSSLEKLVLGMDVDTSQSPEISRMANLQKLNWYVIYDDHDDPFERLSRVDAMQGAEAVRNAFSKPENRNVEVDFFVSNVNDHPASTDILYDYIAPSVLISMTSYFRA
jgi:hypothetical protein